MKWYILQTESGRYLLCAHGLRDLKYEVYIPKTHTRARLGQVAKTVTQLRLHPYLFVQVDYPRQSFAEARGALGAMDFLGQARMQIGEGDKATIENTPRPIDDWVVTHLRRTEDEELEGSMRRVRRERIEFAAGDEVRIIRHRAFAGKTGRILGQQRGMLALVIGQLSVVIASSDVKLERKLADIVDEKKSA